MSRALRFNIAVVAAVASLPLLLLALNALSPNEPPANLGPNDQFLLPSEALPLIAYIAAPAAAVMVALFGMLVFIVAKEMSQVSTLFIVAASLGVSLICASVLWLLWGVNVDVRPAGLYLSAAIAALIPSALFCTIAGLPLWQRGAR